MCYHVTIIPYINWETHLLFDCAIMEIGSVIHILEHTTQQLLKNDPNNQAWRFIDINLELEAFLDKNKDETLNMDVWKQYVDTQMLWYLKMKELRKIHKQNVATFEKSIVQQYRTCKDLVQSAAVLLQEGLKSSPSLEDNAKLALHILTGKEEMESDTPINHPLADNPLSLFYKE